MPSHFILLVPMSFSSSWLNFCAASKIQKLSSSELHWSSKETEFPFFKSFLLLGTQLDCFPASLELDVTRHEKSSNELSGQGVLESQPSHGSCLQDRHQAPHPLFHLVWSEAQESGHSNVEGEGALKKSMQILQDQIKILPSTCSHSASQITAETHWLIMPFIMFCLHTCLLTTPNTVRKRTKILSFYLEWKDKILSFLYLHC